MSGLCLTLLAACGLRSAQAQTTDPTTDPTGARALIVTTTDDTQASDGVVSLREAINTANSDGVDSAITFALGGTIRLTSALPNLSNNGKLSITGPQTGITISGDANDTGVSDNGDVRLFNVNSGADVTLQALTLRGGYSYNGGGSAINNSGGTVLVKNSTVVGNSSAGDSAVAFYHGGAIVNYGTMVINDSTLRNNRSFRGDGGAIYNNGGISLTGCTLLENAASANGGAISNFGSTNLTNCTLAANSAARFYRGGAIYSSYGYLGLTNCTLAYNQAPFGGAISSTAGLGLKNTLFANSSDSVSLFRDENGTPPSTGDANHNFAFSSLSDAGLANLADNGGPTLTMGLLEGSPAIDKGDSTDAPPFDQRGQSRLQGGGIDIGAFEVRNEAPTDLALSNYYFDENEAIGTTVGFFLTKDQSHDRHTYSFVSGAGDADNAAFTIAGNVLQTAQKFNYATRNSYSIRVQTRDLGGLTFEKALTIDVGKSSLVVTTLDDTTTQDGKTSLREAINSANCDGSDSAITFTLGGTIRLTSALAVFKNDGKLSITGPQAGITISGDADNSGTTDNGNVRLFVVNGDANVTLTGLSLTGGNNGYSGGGAVNNAGTLAMTRCTLTNSIAVNFGGALYNSGTATVTGCTFTGNSTQFGGGAIANQGGTLTVTNSTLTTNSAPYQGGAIRNTNGASVYGTLTVVNSTLVRNISYNGFAGYASGNGGAIYNEGTLKASSNTFLDNSSAQGGSIYHSRGEANLKNNLFVSLDFTSRGVFGVDKPTEAGDAKKNYWYPDVYDAGLSELADNGGPTQTLALLEGSPAINRGDSTDAPPFDQRGQARVQQSGIDVGAYESSFATAPTDITLSNSTIADGSAGGTTVGTLSSSDPDRQETFTYSLVNGAGDADNAAFAIDGNALKLAGAASYATQSSYSIRLQTRDLSGLTFQKSFTISVSNLNAAPTDIDISNGGVSENQEIGSTVCVFSTTDPNAGNTFTYSLVNGEGDTNNASFSIEGDVLKTKQIFDYETKNSYTIRVQTRDNGGLTFEKVFTIYVGNVYDEKPSLIVTTLNDAVEEDGVTSLREAINAANSDGVDSAIIITVSGTMRSSGRLGALPALANDGALSITGPQIGPQTGFTLSGYFRDYTLNKNLLILRVSADANVTLNNLVLRDGENAIVNNGTLTVNNCVFTNNYFQGNGGAISNAGTLTVRGCTFENNRGNRGGGAIYNVGSITAVNSTFFRNYGGDGGAILNDDTMTLINSTLLGNTANSVGGAIYNNYTLTMVNCTLASNTTVRSSSSGGNIVNGGTINLQNNLFIGSSNSFLYMEVPTSSGDANKNYLFPSLGAAGLSDLADNGGPTRTMALAAYSPLVNAGLDTTQDPNKLTTDGRGPGFPRKVGSGVDVGAFEFAPLPTLSIGVASAPEGNTGNGSVESGTNFLRLPLTLSSAVTSDVTVTYRTDDGTATAGSDFVGTSTGSLTIPAGQTAGTIVVPVLGDKRYEANETFTVTLTAVSGATLGTSISATGTITNDDQKPTLSINSVSQREGNSGTAPMIFTVSLSAPSDTDTIVPFSTQDGTATAGSDYIGISSGSITIPAGQSSATLTITINGDTTTESDETFSVVLGTPTSGDATLSPQKTGGGTILNDETTPAAATTIGGVSVLKSGYARNRGTNRLVQTILVQNDSGAALAGPVYLVLDNLTGGTLYGSVGNTVITAPTGSPYRIIAAPGNILPVGSTTVYLEFVTSASSVSFTPRVLQGPGSP